MTMSIHRNRTAVLRLAWGLAFLLLAACGEPTKTPEDLVNEPDAESTEVQSSEALATFGGGCFWCTEAVFQELQGVLAVESGYTGGGEEEPTYDEVCSGLTGHAEAVQVRFDPSQVSYAQILEVFFKTHDPTTLNRQGADFGTQYRSVIFAHDKAQRETAEKTKRALDEVGAYDAPIVTEIADFDVWFSAEDHHQDYFASNPGNGYCQAVIQPKLEKFRKVFADRLKPRE